MDSLSSALTGGYAALGVSKGEAATGVKGKIVEAAAEKSVSEAGKEIGLGQRTTRLQLADLDHPQFYIEVIPKGQKNPLSGFFDNIKGHIHYVDLKVNGQTVMVNVNSLAQRLHLDEGELRAAAKQGKLEDFLTKEKGEHIKSLPTRVLIAKNFGNIPEADKREIINEYGKIIDNFAAEGEGTLKTRNGAHDTGISKSELVKVIGLAVKNELPQGGALIKTSAMVQKQRTKGVTTVTINISQAVLAKRDATGKLHLTMLYGKELGTGSAGVVEKVVNLTDGTFKALKTVNTPEHVKVMLAADDKDVIATAQKLLQDKRDNILSEAKLLLEFNPTGTAVGIQKPPQLVYQIAGGAYTPEATGFMMELAEKGDLSSAWKSEDRSVKQNMEGSVQMLKGLVYAKNQGLPHGDIKPQNILVGKNSDGREEFRIADWGGTQFCRNPAEFQKKLEHNMGPAGPKTVGYYYEGAGGDIERMENAGRSGNMDAYKAAAFSRDVFALGATMVQMFLKDENIPTNADFRGEKWLANVGKMRSNGVGEGMIRLLERMVAPPENRFTAEQALAELERIMPR